LRGYVPPGRAFELGRGSVRLYSTLSDRVPNHTARLADLIEVDIAAVEERLGASLPAPVDVVISDDFEVEPGDFTYELGRHVDGFYNRQRNIVFVEYRADLRSLRSTLRHELTHAVVGARFSDLPPWISEGVATVCEDIDDAPIQWTRLLKFAVRLRDRGPVTLDEVMTAPIEDYSDYNDAWAAFYVLERWQQVGPLELVRRLQAGEVDLAAASERFDAFQRRLRGRSDFRLEDVLRSVRPLEELDAEDAVEILSVMGHPATQPVLALEDVRTALDLHRLVLSDRDRRLDPLWTERVLRQAIQPFLDPLIHRELGEIPDLREPASVRRGLDRLVHAEDVYLELVDRLVPGARDLGIDLRPLALRARHEALASWILRHPDVLTGRPDGARGRPRSLR
jgi:hypothetical protein